MSETEAGAATSRDIREAGVPQGIAIIVAAFLPIIAILALGPAIPRIIDHFGAGPKASFLVPILVSAPGLSIALLSPIAGFAADRFGRRRMVTIATFAYALVGSIPLFIDDLNAIIASRLLLGVTEAVILTVVHTLLIDYFGPARRRRWLFIQAVVGPIFATGVLAGSGALTEHAWNGSFLIYGAVALPIAVLMLLSFFEPIKADWAPEPHAPAPGADSGAFPWLKVAAYCLVTLFSSTIYYVVVIQGGLAFQAVGINSPAKVGVLLAIASIGVPLGALIYGWLGKRRAALLIGLIMAFWAVGLTGVGFARDANTMTAMAFIQQVGAGLTVPSLLAWAQGQLPSAHRGKGMGLWTSAFFLGQFTSPLAVDLAKTFAEGRLQGAFLILGGCAAGGALLAAILGARPMPRAPSATDAAAS